MNKSQYNFDPKILDGHRDDGISAFMRIKNGEDFLKLTIESHIDFFDEVIACYNQCTDNTENILLDLQKKYPNKLKIYHYKPYVYPLGSPEQKAFFDKTSKIDIIHSMANYYNFALSKTTKKIAVKLDDDHLCVPENLSKALEIVKKNGLKNIYTFSGINLVYKNNILGVFKNLAFSGNGDICFFPVSRKSYFINLPIYESFTINKIRLPKKYIGILYLHLKFLKKDYGFLNYNLDNKKNKKSFFHNISNLTKNNLQFIEIKNFSNTSLCDFQKLSPSRYEKLDLLKYPLLTKIYFLFRKNNLILNRALSLKDYMQPIINNWEKTKQDLKLTKL